jgi:hypothetical protein
MHILCRKSDLNLKSNSLAVLQRVLENDPSHASLVHGVNGYLPLHELMSNASLCWNKVTYTESIAALVCLVQAWPVAVATKVKDNYLKLSLDDSPPVRVTRVWTPLDRARVDMSEKVTSYAVDRLHNSCIHAF